MLVSKVKNEFVKILNQDSKSYTDSFNDDFINLLGLDDNEANNDNIYDNFFLSFDSLDDIERWIDLVKSKIVMHEHEDVVEDIINEYISLQTKNKIFEEFQEGKVINKPLV